MMEKYINDERTGWKYELVGDYYLPIGTRFEDAEPEEPAPEEYCARDAKLEQERPSIGRFGRAHGEYLKRTQHHVYSQFVAEDKLESYLAQIDEQANNMLDLLVSQMADREGITEQLKAQNQMEWVAAMNSIRSRAEEIVLSEMIFV